MNFVAISIVLFQLIVKTVTQLNVGAGLGLNDGLGIGAGVGLGRDGLGLGLGLGLGNSRLPYPGVLGDVPDQLGMGIGLDGCRGMACDCPPAFVLYAGVCLPAPPPPPPRPVYQILPSLLRRAVYGILRRS